MENKSNVASVLAQKFITVECKIEGPETAESGKQYMRIMLQLSDDDDDGYLNVQEFAFGTNPTIPDQPLTIVRVGNQLVTRFPRRRDAEDRALLYQVEFSSDLEAWTTTTPVQTIVAIVERAAVHPDWMVGKITMPMSDPKHFFRVSVTLDE